MIISKDGYDRVEHDGDVNAKNVSLVKSTATLYAVVNTAAGGANALTTSSGVTVFQGSSPWTSSFSGNITIDSGNIAITSSPTLFAVVNTSAAGQASVVVDGPVALKGNITIDSGNIALTSAPTLFAVVNTAAAGQASVVIDGPVALKGNITIDSGVITSITNPIAFKGNLTIDSGNIALTSAPTLYAVVNTGGFSGNVTLDAGSKTGIVGNVTITDSRGFLGLVTVVQGSTARSIIGNISISSQVAWADPKTYIGLVTVANTVATTFAGNVTIDSGTITTITNPVAIKGNLTLTDSKGFLGLVTVVQGSTSRSIVGNVTLSDAKTYVGLATVTPGRGHQFMGLATVVQSSSARSITGNITLSDSKGFIGLATVVPSYGSDATVYTGIVSSTGNTTVAVAPASNRFFIKNIHISSLATANYEIRSGATTLVPFTYTNAGSGFLAHYGEMGLPARAQQDGLVINLNGGATISYMFNVRYAA